MDKSKYTIAEINIDKSGIQQFGFSCCINSEDISDNYDNIYYPLYLNDKNIDLFLPGNDKKENDIYSFYSKNKEYMDKNSSSQGAYIFIFNIIKEKEEIFLKLVDDNGGYPTRNIIENIANNQLGMMENKIILRKKLLL